MHHKPVRLMPGLWLRNLFIALCLSGIGLFSPAMQAAQAASVVVNTTDDAVDDDDGQCSLREAITAANDDAPSGDVGGECRGGSGVDTIVLDEATYTLDSTLGPLDVSSDMWIIGEGASMTLVEGAGDAPVFDVTDDAEVVIAHLTVSNGGTASGESGGGIHHSGTGNLTLYRVTVTANTASASGGGIYSDSSGALSIVDSTVSDNSLNGDDATDAVLGGGVHHAGGSLLIVNSAISGNDAGDTGMLGLDASGGGIYAEGDSFNMFYSTVSGNTAATADRLAFGGGVATDLADALISHSTISGNLARTDADDQPGAGGGVGNFDTLTVRNSTISGNEAHSDFEAHGGGLANFDDAGSVSLVQVTVTDNQVSTTGGSTFGAGVDTASGSISAANTVIAENDSIPDGADQCDDTLTAIGANADSDDTCGFTITEETFNFVALADNGGRTQTHAVTAGSALIGAGTQATCEASGIDSLDQRLASRLSSCTIGAYEYGGGAPLEPAALDDTASVEEDPLTPLSVDAPGVLLTDTPADLSAEQTPAGLFSYSAPTGPSHAASFTLNPDGSYSYMPEENFYGDDPFLYWLTDGGDYPYDMALVRLTVTGVNDDPFFDPSTISFDNLFEDSVVGIHGLVIQDFDLEDCPGAVIKVRLKVEHGTLWLGSTTGLTFTIGDGLQSTLDKEIQFWGSLDDVNAALATLKYQGDQDYNGDESLVIGLNDMGYCDGDETGEGGCEGGGPGGTGPGGPGNDDHEIVYDGEDAVSFSIAPVNDAPVNSVPGTQNTAVDTPLPITGVTFKDVDLDRAEGDGMAHVVLTVVNGTASVTAAGTAVVTGDGSASVDILGPYADVKATLASLVFTPPAGFMGTATIKVDTDDQGNYPGDPASDSDSFDIIIGPCGLVNCSFEEPAGPNKFPTGWKRAGLKLPGDGTDTGVHQHLAQSFRFKGTGNAQKLYQDVAITGPAGDDLSLSFWWKGEKVKGRPGQFRVVAYLTYKNNTKGKFTINLPVGTNDWTQNTLPIHASKAYKKLRVEIDFGKKGMVWFDNFVLTN